MEDKKEILVLSAGGSEEPLIYSINEFKPDYVYFIHSAETRKNCDIVLNKSGFEGEYYFTEITDHESLDESFIKSKELFSTFDNDKFNIRVDFTGGTKPMVSGIVLAVIEGNFSNFKLNYVGQKNSESRTKNGVGVVKDGSELSKIQENPYRKYAINEFKRGKNFFNSYQFEASLENFENAYDNLEKGPMKDEAYMYVKLVQLYKKWDLFDDKASKSKNLYEFLNNIIYNIEHYDNLHESFKDKEFFNQMKLNLEFLSLRIRGFKGEKAPAKPMKERVKYYLPDLLNNAYRRIEEGKYDDAVARLYRANELIAQIKLVDLGLVDEGNLSSNKVFHINKFAINDKALNSDNCEEILDFVEENEDRNSKNLKIASAKSYELLELFGFEQAKEFETINKDLRIRNNSILAHGLNPMKDKKTKDLYEDTVNYANKFFPDLKELMEIAEFPKFDI